MSITIFIIIFTVMISIAAWRSRELFDKLKLNAYMVAQKKEYFRVVSHALLHVDWSHLVFNMLTLWFFGDYIEVFLDESFNAGKFLFVLFYLLGAIISTVPSVIKNKNNHYYNSVGASGAVSAVLFASILLYPQNKLMIFPIPIPIPGYVLGLLYLVYSHYMSRKKADNINHDAHLTGALFGFIFPVALKPELFMVFIDNILG